MIAGSSCGHSDAGQVTARRGAQPQRRPGPRRRLVGAKAQQARQTRAQHRQDRREFAPRIAPQDRLGRRLGTARKFAAIPQGFGEGVQWRRHLGSDVTATSGGWRGIAPSYPVCSVPDILAPAGRRGASDAAMIVIGTETVERYFAAHAGSRGIRAGRSQYEVWLAIARRARWRNPEDAKASHPRASILKGGGPCSTSRAMTID